MPSSVPLDDLEHAKHELEALQMKYPDAYQEFADFFRENRGLGYKNLIRMLMDEQTPKEIKGIDEDAETDA